MNQSAKIPYLTKSAFKLGLTCPTKLHYLLAGYPRIDEENEYLKLLSEGGFLVGALAQLLFPKGANAPRTDDAERDFVEVKRLLDSNAECVLFEATLVAGRKLAIADIVERHGKILRLIEVKSKSFDSAESGGADAAQIFRNKKGDIAAEWMEYLFDVAFQKVVLDECLPEYKIECHLLMVDKAKRSEVEGLPSYLRLERDKKNDRPRVIMPQDTSELLKAAQVLTQIDVSQEISEILPLAKETISILEESLVKRKKIPARLGIRCRDCEFRDPVLEKDGYKECWKQIPEPAHHAFDLYFGTALKVDKELVLDSLFAQGKASLFDIPLEALKGKRGERQLIQIEYTKKNEEWFDARLFSFLAELRYPLHFIDFETTRTALPFHAGMRPFEQLAFQWSCHTVTERDAAPQHTEWINVDPVFPNFAFAKSLQEVLSKEGTVLTWATHEASVLADIRDQMRRYGHDDRALEEFLELLVSSKGSQGRLVDMNRLTAEYYFHPAMKGKTSIKKVFPAIWKSNAALRKLPWFSEYEALDGDEVGDPYSLLPELPVGGDLGSVKEGTDAMKAYASMIFGTAASDPELKANWKQLLLQYCKLDTLAMVAIWEHWEQKREGRTV